MRPPIALDVGWRTCDARDDTSAPCLGSVWQSYDRCLAHLAPDELERVLKGLAPGAALDLRGTTIDAELLARILAAAGGRLGRARFERARFTGPARFGQVVFAGDASFDHARFEARASFFDTRFAANVSFWEADFAREFSMHGSQVQGHASFEGASVGNDALYGKARFARSASFRGARFRGFASFDGTGFGGDVTFRGVRFGRAVSFGGTAFARVAAFEGARFAAGAFLRPASVGRRLVLTGAHAQGPLAIDAGGCVLDLRHARIMNRLTVRISGGQVDLEGLVVHGSATVSPHDPACREPSTGPGMLRIVSLDDVEADRLTLVGADLSGCRLSRVRRPERLRLRDCVFASPPPGLQLGLRWPPVRWWSRRQLLADERVWRGWAATGTGGQDPGGLAVLYSHLRGALDDERTAADFAFGAMEMRRLGASRRVGRLLLGAYWLVCGYGMRMGRALAWFTLLAALTVGVLMWWTAPHASRRPVSHRPIAPAHAVVGTVPN
jgi:hypothetical protein